MTTKLKIKKNAAIELMRFIIASVIVFFHAGKDIWNSKKVVATIGTFKISVFKRGHYGVEFFFLLTGLLMASSIWRSMGKPREREVSVGEETVSFLWRKIKGILPSYLTVSVMMLLVNFWMKTRPEKIIEKLPSVIFLDRFGFAKISLVSVSWYLGAMLFALAIAYPLCRSFYGTYTTLIGPLAGLIILGMLVHNKGELVGVNEWAYFTNKMNLRALGEVGIGAACFEIARRLENKEYSNGKRLLFSLIAIAGFVGTLIYLASFAPKKTGWVVIFMLCPTLVITWSRIGLIGRSGVLQNRFFVFLGSLSLPLYLFQNVPRSILPVVMKNIRPGIILISEYLLTLVLALIVYFVQQLRYRRQTPVA